MSIIPKGRTEKQANKTGGGKEMKFYKKYVVVIKQGSFYKTEYHSPDGEIYIGSTYTKSYSKTEMIEDTINNLNDRYN